MNAKLFKSVSFIVLISCFSLYPVNVSAQGRVHYHSNQVKRATPYRTPPSRVTRPSTSQAKKAEKQRLFNHYSNLAYDALNRNQLALFLRYSDYALQTGNSSARLYYDRGYVYETLGDYTTAQKEYKKAERMGYAPARYTLRELEIKMKRWR